MYVIKFTQEEIELVLSCIQDREKLLNEVVEKGLINSDDQKIIDVRDLKDRIAREAVNIYKEDG